jgi:hypothetical protein
VDSRREGLSASLAGNEREPQMNADERRFDQNEMSQSTESFFSNSRRSRSSMTSTDYQRSSAFICGFNSKWRRARVPSACGSDGPVRGGLDEAMLHDDPDGHRDYDHDGQEPPAVEDERLELLGIDV